MPTLTLRFRSTCLALVCSLPLLRASPAMAQGAAQDAGSVNLSARQVKLQERATDAFRQHRMPWSMAAATWSWPTRATRPRRAWPS